MFSRGYSSYRVFLCFSSSKAVGCFHHHHHHCGGHAAAAAALFPCAELWSSRHVHWTRDKGGNEQNEREGKSSSSSSRSLEEGDRRRRRNLSCSTTTIPLPPSRSSTRATLEKSSKRVPSGNGSGGLSMNLSSSTFTTSSSLLTRRLTGVSSSSAGGERKTIKKKKTLFRPTLQPGEVRPRVDASTAAGAGEQREEGVEEGQVNRGGWWGWRARRGRPGSPQNGQENTSSSFSFSRGHFHQVVAEKGFAFALVLYMLGEAVNLTAACIWHCGCLGKWFDIRFLLLLFSSLGFLNPPKKNRPIPTNGGKEEEKRVDGAKKEKKEEQEVDRATNKHIPPHPSTTTGTHPHADPRSPPFPPHGVGEVSATASLISHLLESWDGAVTTFRVDSLVSSSNNHNNVEGEGGNMEVMISDSSIPSCLYWIEWLDKGPYLWEEEDLRLSLRFAFHYGVMNVLLKPFYPYQFKLCERVIMPLLRKCRTWVPFSFKKNRISTTSSSSSSSLMRV